MPTDLWISLTMKMTALGHSLRDAQQMAAVILIERLVVYTIMGYRLPASEPERIPTDFAVTRKTRTGGMRTLVGFSRQVPGLRRIATALFWLPNNMPVNGRDKSRTGT